MTETKTKTASEIQTKITTLKEGVEKKKEQIEDYQGKRAQVVVNGEDSQNQTPQFLHR